MWIWFPIIAIYIIITVAVHAIIATNTGEIKPRHARRIVLWPVFLPYDLMKSFIIYLLLSIRIDIRR